MVRVINPNNLVSAKGAILNLKGSAKQPAVNNAPQTEKGFFIISLGHQQSGDTGAPNTAAPSTNKTDDNAFANEASVISSVAVDLITKAVGISTGLAFIPWIAKSVLSNLIAKPIRNLVKGRSYDCLIQIHSDMVKKYAINDEAGDVIIYYGSSRGLNIANAIRKSILSRDCDLIKNVNVIHHTKSWRKRLGFIADSSDTALILEYDSVARDRNQMIIIADAINKSIVDVQPELKNIPY